MNSHPVKRDLKNAPPQDQVTAISYCGDTYRVETADGKVKWIRELDLRFMTDSGDFGPRPGAPVIVGGTYRYHASVVFAAPSEISGFISETCLMGEDDSPF